MNKALSLGITGEVREGNQRSLLSYDVLKNSRWRTTSAYSQGGPGQEASAWRVGEYGVEFAEPPFAESQLRG